MNALFDETTDQLLREENVDAQRDGALPAP
jgi:hypothetical protein